MALPDHIHRGPGGQAAGLVGLLKHGMDGPMHSAAHNGGSQDLVLSPADFDAFGNFPGVDAIATAVSVAIPTGGGGLTQADVEAAIVKVSKEGTG